MYSIDLSLVVAELGKVNGESKLVVVFCDELDTSLHLDETSAILKSKTEVVSSLSTFVLEASKIELSNSSSISTNLGFKSPTLNDLLPELLLKRFL